MIDVILNNDELFWATIVFILLTIVIVIPKKKYKKNLW